MTLVMRLLTFCLSASEPLVDIPALLRAALIAAIVVAGLAVVAVLVWSYWVSRTGGGRGAPKLGERPGRRTKLVDREGMMGSIWRERIVWVLAGAVAIIGGGYLTSSPYPIVLGWGIAWALAMFLTMALIRAAARRHGSPPEALRVLDVALVVAVGVVSYAAFEDLPPKLVVGAVGLVVLFAGQLLFRPIARPIALYRRRMEETAARLEASGRAGEVRERRRRFQLSALLSGGIAAGLLTGLVLFGVLDGLPGLILWFGAVLVTILLVRAAVADHGWGTIGLRLLDILAGTIVVVAALGGLGFNLYGCLLTAFGIGMLVVNRRWLGPEPQLSQRGITAEMLLPPARRGGATLVSVLVALGIVAMTMTLALRAYWQGSRLASLEHQRTLAAAECQAQLEQTRARGWGAMSAVGEHEFRSEAGEGRLSIAPGPVDGSRRVTATVSWPRRDDIPAGSVELVTIMAGMTSRSARGVGG